MTGRLQGRAGAATARLAWGTVLVLAAGAAAGAAGCRGAAAEGEPYRTVAGGNADRGERLLGKYGCGACHMIPGERAAVGTVGPPLTNFARRANIGGEAPNEPEQLVLWLKNPQAIEPGTAMPNLGVTDRDALDIAAYLYTLR